jgi:hypothetical protein
MIDKQETNLQIPYQMGKVKMIYKHMFKIRVHDMEHE